MTTTQHTKYGYLRDSQRRKVYRAENRALNHHSLGQQYETVSDCHEYLMGIIERKTFKRWFPKAARTLVWRLEVRPGYGARRAFAMGRWGITLPRWGRNEPVMIHELCHLVVDYEFPRHEVAWHGWQFCQTYLKIVGNVMGPEAAARLKAEFKAEGVRFTPPRKKREMTEADKQVLRDRLVVARAAKARKQ